jgi:hypothetical protein
LLAAACRQYKTVKTARCKSADRVIALPSETGGVLTTTELKWPERHSNPLLNQPVKLIEAVRLPLRLMSNAARNYAHFTQKSAKKS